MAATPKPLATVGLVLPWTNMMLDYTDRLTALIPDDKLHWRPEDPSGRFTFSLGEIAMHCADARRMFARQLSGEARVDDYWSEGPGEDGVWQFKECTSPREIEESLKTAREELQSYLDLPASSITEVLEPTRKVFEKALAELKAQGKDTTEYEARGPANVMRVLMALVAHESGHRGALQTLLRQQGVNAPLE